MEKRKERRKKKKRKEEKEVPEGAAVDTARGGGEGIQGVVGLARVSGTDVQNNLALHRPRQSETIKTIMLPSDGHHSKTIMGRGKSDDHQMAIIQRPPWES